MPQVQRKHSTLRLPPLIPNAAPPMEVRQLQPKTQWLTITPDLAMKWLDEANTNNRPIREEHVKRFAEDMTPDGKPFETV